MEIFLFASFCYSILLIHISNTTLPLSRENSLMRRMEPPINIILATTWKTKLKCPFFWSEPGVRNQLLNTLRQWILTLCGVSDMKNITPTPNNSPVLRLPPGSLQFHWVLTLITQRCCRLWKSRVQFHKICSTTHASHKSQVPRLLALLSNLATNVGILTNSSFSFQIFLE